MRYYLIDLIEELRPGESARGVKCVTLTDEILHDHFPDHPTLPGALIVEAAAQLSGFLVEMSFNREGAPLKRALLAQIRDAKFYEPCGPGDRLVLTASLESAMETAARVNVDVVVRGKRAARANLTFILKEIASERVHEQRRYVYRLWTRHFDPPLTIL